MANIHNAIIPKKKTLIFVLVVIFFIRLGGGGYGGGLVQSCDLEGLGRNTSSPNEPFRSPCTWEIQYQHLFTILSRYLCFSHIASAYYPVQ